MTLQNQTKYGMPHLFNRLIVLSNMYGIIIHVNISYLLSCCAYVFHILLSSS